MKDDKITRTVLYNTLISYLIIFVVFIGIWIAAMSWISDVMKQKNQVIYGNLLEVLSYSTDKDLMIVERAAMNTALSGTTVRMLDNFRANSKDILQIKDVKESMEAMMQNQNAIKNGFIYVPDKDYIVAYNTTGSTLTYYRTYIKENGIAYEDWIAFLNTIKWNGYYHMNTTDTSLLYYAYLTPIGSKNKEAVVLMQVNPSVIAGISGMKGMESLKLEVLADNGLKVVPCEQEDDSQTVSFRSADTGWYYIGHVENADFDGILQRVIIWLIVGVIAFGLTCFIVLQISLKTNYSPLTEIVKNISSVIENPDKAENVYDYITVSLEKLITKQKEDSLELEIQGEKLKEVYLQYLFSGRGRNIKESDLKLFDLDFVYEGFFLAFFNIEANIAFEKNGIYFEKEKIVDGVYAGQVEGRTGYFLKEEEIINLEDRLSKLKNYIVYLSGLHRDGTEIYAAREEVGMLFKAYGIMKERKQIFFYDDYQKEKKQNKLKSEILECIEKNYMNPDLSVEFVCQQLNKSVSGVNKQLKETGEEGILYYINIRRVEEAKKIIEINQGTVPVKEIMSQVGYTNLNTFIRVFKKYEGITPGEYCKTQQNTQITNEKS